jgi:hypothetical protein
MANGKNIPFTNDDIINVAYEYDISPDMLAALIAQESLGGTSNVAINNNNYGGITWNNNTQSKFDGLITDNGKGTSRPSAEGGNYVKFNSPIDGLKAQALLISERTNGETEKTAEDNLFNEYKQTLTSLTKREFEQGMELAKSGKAIGENDKNASGNRIKEVARQYKVYMLNNGIPLTADDKTNNIMDKLETALGLNGKYTQEEVNNVWDSVTGQMQTGRTFLSKREKELYGIVVGIMNQLTSQNALTELTDLKANGGNPGAMSDSEWRIISDANEFNANTGWRKDKSNSRLSQGPVMETVQLYYNSVAKAYGRNANGNKDASTNAEVNNINNIK